MADVIVVNLYRNNSDPTVLNKDLEFIRIFRGVFREPFDVALPVLQIQYADPIDFNYISVPSLKRFYFVKSVTNIASNLWELELSVDVLESYKNTVLGLTAVIERNEFSSDPLIIDTFQVYKQGYEVYYQYGNVDIGGELSLNDDSDRFIINAPLFELEPVGNGGA